jgi:hypothetical protein
LRSKQEPVNWVGQKEADEFIVINRRLWLEKNDVCLMREQNVHQKSLRCFTGTALREAADFLRKKLCHQVLLELKRQPTNG